MGNKMNTIKEEIQEFEQGNKKVIRKKVMDNNVEKVKSENLEERIEINK